MLRGVVERGVPERVMVSEVEQDRERYREKTIVPCIYTKGPQRKAVGGRTRKTGGSTPSEV
jgi:hypothetical protein